ncbi:MAG: ATP-binding protein, partial [Bacteroidota bacterium]|nr:ATP-binding protein [Bacteroidota bacterium]
LGLSLVKRIVEGHHGGKVSVKSSKLGKGTTFEVVLPKHR